MSNGQTIVKYGDVILYRCFTRRIEQRPVMDSAGTSLKCWQFIVHVTGYLHGFPDACKYHALASDPGGTDYSMSSQAHKQVRWRLAPRQRFVLAVGCVTDIASGNTLLFADPMTGVATPDDLAPTAGLAGLGGYDVDDGPRCLQFDIAHISGDSIFKVDAAFEIHRVQCDDDDNAAGNLNGVLSHRWTSIDALDVNLRTTRTYRGQLELATSNFSPHWFRHLVVPPIQKGMRRERMEFVASNDGRKLQYTIVDQSVSIAAPPPARRWNVEHTEASIGQDGLKQSCQVAVSLEGDEYVDKGHLIILGLYVAFAKLQGSKPGENPANDAPFLMNDITITEITGDLNAVRITASGWRVPGELKDNPANPKGVHVVAAGLNTVIGAADLPAFAANYDPRRSADGRAGEAPPYQGPVPLAGIFRCYLQSPCNSITGLNIQTNQINDQNGVPDDQPQAAVNLVIVPAIVAEIPDYYSTSHQTAMYTSWQMESRYDTKQMRAAMPIAAVPLSGGFDTSDACAIVSLSRPQCRRHVRIQAERVGEWPEFPNAETMDDGTASLGGTAITQKVLKQKLLGGTITKSCNGEDLYRARMEIVFALLRAPDPTEQLKFGNNKWSSAGQTVSTTILTNSPH